MLLCLAVQPQARSAVVKKANGEVVQGDIQGYVLLKGRAQQIEIAAKKQFQIDLLRVYGEGIASIDKEGIRVLQKRGNVRLIVGVKPNAAPGVDEVLGMAESQEGGFSAVESKSGAVAVVIDQPCDERGWHPSAEGRMEMIELAVRAGVLKPATMPIVRAARVEQQLLAKKCEESLSGSGAEATVLFRGTVRGVVEVQSGGTFIKIPADQILRTK